MLDVSATPIAGLFTVYTRKFSDARGSFARIFCDDELRGILGGRTIRQINISHTAAKGTIRGMHFQHPPFAEMKFVSCIKGAVMDIAVDLRTGSQTFLSWHGEELSAGNSRMFVIPEGCAHGFQVLEPGSELLYLHTAPYTPSAEGAVPFDDPLLGIDWPLAPTEISARDRGHSRIQQNFPGLKT